MTQQPYQPHPQYAEVQPYQQWPQYGYELVPANWSDRATAYVVDGAFLVVVLIVCAVVRAALDPSDGDPSIIAMVVVILVAVLWNRIYLQSRTGQSIGKRVMRIQLLSEHTSLPPGVARTLGREVLGFILGRIPLLNLVWALSPLWDSKRCAWHDAAFSTVVVKRPKV